MSEQFGRKIRIIGKYFSVCVHGFLQENIIIISLLKKNRQTKFWRKRLMLPVKI